MQQLDLFGQQEDLSRQATFGSTAALPFTISQLTGHIRRLFEEDATLRDVWVEGEVSTFTRAASGHCYFTLKDAGAEIRCVMWRDVANAQRQLPQHGAQVLARGSVSVYEARGTYQLYVEEIHLTGAEGDLYQQFVQLKERLEAEGLFDPTRKRPLPVWPRRVGIVTSPTAAALRDILHVLGRRYPLVEVLLSPTLVQGSEAPPQIVAAIEALSAQDVDLVIVARGGGSLEDLWAFNNEDVARAIAACRHPVICGVGHETDYTIADLSADVRAPTPSAAAELAVPDRVELKAAVRGLSARLSELASGQIEERRAALNSNRQALRHLAPEARLREARQRVDDLMASAMSSVRHELALRHERLVGLSARLESLSPLATLTRGYAIVRQEETGELVNSVTLVSPGDRLAVRVADGSFGARVEAQSVVSDENAEC